jgi:1,4-dihydroxy-2-naphthoate octaprenyltransferase
MMQRFFSLLELGKFKIVELWLGFFVGVSLLGAHWLGDWRAVLTLVLILLVGIAVIAATCSLDDLIGWRDGVDQANHIGRARSGVNKPLLSGRLRAEQASSFIVLLGAVIVLGIAATVALAWPLPIWLVALMLVMMAVALNYSYGLKLSYHGAGELVIWVGGAGTVLIPYALVAQELTPMLLLQSFLVGSWHAQVVVFSNTYDVQGDRATGRRSIATRLSAPANKAFITAVFVLSWLVTLGFFGAGLASPWLLVALVPVWFLQVRQLVQGVGQQQWLLARRTGFWVLRVGILALTVANLYMQP